MTELRSRAVAAARVNDSWLMIGLDPVMERMPDGIPRTPSGVVQFNSRIIEATRDLVLGYKPNFAFYEVLGADGWRTLRQTREAIPRDLIALADGKRGDIGDTSEMYARSIFDSLGFDAATVSPYVGLEGLQPFLQRRDRGVFVLCRTSNRDGAVQSIVDDSGQVLSDRVAREAATWGPNVGLVVGATDLEALAATRRLTPMTAFLVPGVGVQGGDPGVAGGAACDERGQGAIISVSRQVLYASPGPDFAEAARSKAIEIRDSLRAGLQARTLATRPV